MQVMHLADTQRYGISDTVYRTMPRYEFAWSQGLACHHSMYVLSGPESQARPTQLQRVAPTAGARVLR